MSDDFLLKYKTLKRDLDRSCIASCVKAVYDFKDELLKNNSREALEVLVLVYDLLNLKQSAYDLLLKIGDKSDLNVQKRLLLLKSFADRIGDSRAIMLPQSKEEIDNELKELKEVFGLPYFKYHRNPLKTNTFKKSEQGVICSCCKKKINYYYTGPFYTKESIEYLCPMCIKKGKASEKFFGEFINVDDKDAKEINDFDKIEELSHKTPAFTSFTLDKFRVHCHDFCTFIGYVGYKDIRSLGILKEVLDDDYLGSDGKKIVKTLVNGGDVQGYLFQCLHCKKYLLAIDKKESL